MSQPTPAGGALVLVRARNWKPAGLQKLFYHLPEVARSPLAVPYIFGEVRAGIAALSVSFG